MPITMRYRRTIRKYMKAINDLRGTNYDLVDYYGCADAEEVIVTMGSSAQTITTDGGSFAQTREEKSGVLTIHLYRPFPLKSFWKNFHQRSKAIAVLDRNKREPGANGESLL